MESTRQFYAWTRKWSPQNSTEIFSSKTTKKAASSSIMSRNLKIAWPQRSAAEYTPFLGLFLTSSRLFSIQLFKITCMFSGDLQADILSRADFPRAGRFPGSLRFRRAFRPAFQFPFCPNQICCLCHFRLITIPTWDEKFINRREYHWWCVHSSDCYCRLWSEARTERDDRRWRDCWKGNKN